jgi:hypothetical protein
MESRSPSSISQDRAPTAMNNLRIKSETAIGIDRDHMETRWLLGESAAVPVRTFQVLDAVEGPGRSRPAVAACGDSWELGPSAKSRQERGKRQRTSDQAGEPATQVRFPTSGYCSELSSESSRDPVTCLTVQVLRRESSYRMTNYFDPRTNELGRTSNFRAILAIGIQNLQQFRGECHSFGVLIAIERPRNPARM